MPERQSLRRTWRDRWPIRMSWRKTAIPVPWQESGIWETVSGCSMAFPNGIPWEGEAAAIIMQMLQRREISNWNMANM